MQLDSASILRILKEKGITHLYHANTVKTACSFIQEGGLLSRGAVESRGLVQTPQSSDSDDKFFEVWNDIFLDSSDLHALHGRQNYYGPVLFKFSVDVLSIPNLPPLWITNNNPIYWDRGSRVEERYFQSINQVEKEYMNGAVKEMITLRNTLSPLPFHPYLEEIILDDPDISIDGVNLFKHASAKLANAIKGSHLDMDNVKRVKRKCGYCWCTNNYAKQKTPNDLKLLFTK